MNKDVSAITSSSASGTADTDTSKTGTEGELPKGTVLKQRFLLTSLIATGGTSYIYKARDLLAAMNADESSEIVLKVTKHNLHDETSPTEIALHEALTARNLAHPNIVKVYDYDCDNQHCFVTMEYLSGEPLSRRLQRSVDNKLSYRQAMEIAKPIASALHYAHCHGVVHSDIKPGNIILASEGVVKVIDFGTARPNSQATRASNQANEADYSGFTPVYASPQTLKDQAATASDDVYSFACTLYEMLAGRHPFSRVTADIAERKNIQAKRFKSINVWQWLVLKKALSFKQKQRYSDISRFMKLFTRARYIWSGLAVLVISISLSGYVIVSAVSSFKQHMATDKHLVTVSNNLQQTTNLIERIHQAPALDRIKIINNYNDLPDLFRDAVYQGVQPWVIDDAVAEVKQKLYNNTDVPDYTSLASIITEIRQYYPDSAKLSGAAKLISQERQEYGSALLIKYSEQLEETTFTADDASDIRLTRDKLHRLGLDTPEIDRQVALRFINALNVAYKQYDYLHIDQLITFKKMLSMTLPASLAAKIEIDPLQIEAAQALAQYERGSLDQPRQYPKLAAAHFWSPYFNKIGPRIKNTWKDRKLYALKLELENLSKRIPDSYPPLVTARNDLAEQFRSKARYYKRKGIYKSQMYKLNKSANELLSTTSTIL